MQPTCLLHASRFSSLRILAIALLASFWSVVGAAAEIPFNDGSRFQRIDDGSTPQRPSPALAWSTVSLPHKPRIESRVVNDQWQGIASYAKRFHALRSWRGQTVMLSYWFFRSQRPPDERSALLDGGPMVRIASHWVPGSSPRIRVFSNAEEVELKLNGRSLGTKRATRDAMSDRLAYPPFHFDARAFERGTLEAIAFIGGRAVASHRLETPSAPYRLKVELDDAGVSPTEGDLVFARAVVLDQAGRTVATAAGAATFEASGNFEIVGQKAAEFEAGTASVLMRVKKRGARGTVRATSEELIARRQLVVSRRLAPVGGAVLEKRHRASGDGT